MTPRPASRHAPRHAAGRGAAVLLLLPLFVLVVGLIAYPFYRAVWLSFTDKLVGYPERFVGLRELHLPGQRRHLPHGDPQQPRLHGGLGGAQVRDRHRRWRSCCTPPGRWRNFFRGLLLLPWITSTVIIALTWRWMFDAFPGRGFFNSVLLDAGLLSATDRLHGHAGGRHGRRHRRQLVARLPVLRRVLPGRHAVDPDRAVRGGLGGRGQRRRGASGTSRCPG